MGGFIVYSDATGLIICLAALLTASVLTVDPYACTPTKAQKKPPELVLDCTKQAGHLVTGFIRGGHVKQLRLPKKPKETAAAAANECPVPDKKTACWANPISGQLLSLVQECLWKKAVCKLPVNGPLLGYPCFAQPATYLFAEQFKCIQKSRIVHLCSSSAKEPQLSLKPSDGETFILSKGYPDIVAANLNCSLTITTEAKSLLFEPVYMHIHPKRKLRPTCEVDYLDIRPAAPVTGSTDGVRYCGRDEHPYTSSATASRIQFVSGQERKHYGGFVVRVTAVSANDSTQDEKAPEAAVNSSEVKVKNSNAAIPNKIKRVSVERTRNTAKPKS